MSWPQTPLDVVVSLDANGRQDISSYVRRSDIVTILHAVPSANSSVANPSSCEMQLNDSDGRFSTLHPTGAYVDYLSQASRLWVDIRAARDHFTRSASNGWDSSTSGHTYTLGGLGGTVQNSDFSVDGDEGLHSVPVADATRYTQLSTEVRSLIDITVDCRLSITAPTGGVVSALVEFRGISDTVHCTLRAQVNTAGSTITLSLEDGDAAVVDIAVLGGFSGLDTNPMRLRVLAEGRSVRAKAWRPTSSEPDWQLDGQVEHTTAGWIKLKSFVATGNSNTKPIVFYWDNLDVRVPRFTGEFGPPGEVEWEPSEATVWRHVHATGVMGRLEQNRSLLPSTPISWVRTVSPAPTAFWSMESGSTVDSLPASVSTVPALTAWSGVHPSGAVVGPPQWGSGSVAPWLPAVTSRSQQAGMTILAAVGIPMGATDRWTVEIMVNGGTAGLDGAIDINPQYLDGAAGWPQLSFIGATSQIGITHNGVAEVFTTLPALFDGQPHHVRWEIVQSGSSVLYNIYVDQLGAVLSGTVTTWTVPLITSIGLVAEANANFSQGYLKIWTTAPAHTLALEAAFGYRGETAGRRFQRLCDQENIENIMHGDPDDTAQVGPQYVTTLLKALQDCVEVDRGLLLDSRGGGLLMVTAEQRHNRAVTLELDYSSRGHIAPPLTPIEGDRVVNFVLANRPDGLIAEAEQETGPLGTDNIGPREDSVTLHTYTDAQTLWVATWQTLVGTSTDPRYSPITIWQHSLAGEDLELSMNVTDACVGDRCTISNLPAWCGPNDADQIIAGSVEMLGKLYWSIAFNGIPAAPWDVGNVDTSWSDTSGTTLTAGIDDNDTSFQVTVVGSLWTTSGASLPVEIAIGGERMMVTAISGGSSPQTFTATRSVNGVVKSHSADAAVSIIPLLIVVP
jgi:hypothetical protein